jgi:23S rRNA (adenine2503-C2)-methyltransferase
MSQRDRNHVVTPILSIVGLRERLHALGAKPDHTSHLLRQWLNARRLDTPRGRRKAEHDLPASVRAALPELTQALSDLARAASKHAGADGSARLLVQLHDGQSVEAVLLPPRLQGNRAGAHGLCVSTQVGCAVGCTFCKTGEGGLARQMGSAEIVAQLALARSQRHVNKVVFMGMGEPAHNLDAVLEAIDLLGAEGGIAHHNLVLSTVGDARLFERLLERAAHPIDRDTDASLPAASPVRVRPALALSLHSTDDAKRKVLLPRAPRIDVAELIAQADRYARAIGYPAQLQWALIDGVNDGDDEVDALVAMLRGRHAILNMIPCNAVEGFAHRRPSAQRCDAIFHALNRRGVLTRMRQSAGQDVDAGCGQLRSRVVAQSSSSVVQIMKASGAAPASAASTHAFESRSPTP